MGLTSIVLIFGCALAAAPAKAAPAKNARAAAPPSKLESDEAEAAADEAEVEEAGGPGFGGKGAAKSPAAKKQPAAPAAKAAESEPALAPVNARAARAGEAEALIDSLAGPGQIALPGSPTPLVELMSRLIDRRQQIEVTQTYWKLSAAVAEYRICGDSFSRLRQLAPAEEAAAAPNDPLLAARLAAAEARLREAEAEVLAHQYLLAELARWTAPNTLPLPADLPHVGRYLTEFQQVYSGKIPPPRAYLVDRSLPLRLRSIEMRAAAVTAAAHAIEGDADAFSKGQLDRIVVMDSIAELARQQRAFIVSVLEYNRDIAEYALSIAPPGFASARLVGLLIPQRKGDSSQVEPDDGVRQAGFDQPAADQPAADRQAGNQREPKKVIRSHHTKSDRSKGDSAEPGGPGAAPVKPDDEAEPGAAAVEANAEAEAQPAEGANGGDERRYKANKPLADAEQDAGPPPGLYPALADLPPPQRAQELGSALHWNHQSPGALGEPLSLIDCLAWRSTGADRGALVAAYWQARHRAARHQVLTQQLEQLQALDPAALHWRDRADGAEAMLRLKTAQRAAEADLIESELDLRVGQFMLAQLGGRPLGGEWPLPTTAPHAGRYNMKLESQPSPVARSAEVQRLAATIPKWHEVLAQQSAAVVAADAARADATHRFEQGEISLDGPLVEIREQTGETLGFLKTLNEYNLQIAEYLRTVLPAGTDNATLARAMALDPRGE
ncbi:MAG TPA: hypothetical protein VGN42_00815 [Pirellulales bacterium]|nr:hypothetical protein [Pirellulales bacterium]